jgi:hypothetical protein
VVYSCCWRSPAQSFSGPSPVGLTMILYCLRFETSLSVASHDSQDYGGPRLHMRLNYSSVTVILLTSRHGPRRRHRSSVAAQFSCSGGITSHSQSYIAADGVEHHLGLVTRYLLLFDSYGLIFLGQGDITYSIVTCTAIGTDRTENNTPLFLFTGYYLVTGLHVTILKQTLK